MDATTKDIGEKMGLIDYKNSGGWTNWEAIINYNSIKCL
jgi:hypothetical protein